MKNRYYYLFCIYVILGKFLGDFILFLLVSSNRSRVGVIFCKFCILRDVFDLK